MSIDTYCTIDYMDVIHFGSENDYRYWLAKALHTGCNARHQYTTHIFNSFDLCFLTAVILHNVLSLVVAHIDKRNSFVYKLP